MVTTGDYVMLDNLPYYYLSVGFSNKKWYVIADIINCGDEIRVAIQKDGTEYRFLPEYYSS